MLTRFLVQFLAQLLARIFGPVAGSVFGPVFAQFWLPVSFNNTPHVACLALCVCMYAYCLCADRVPHVCRQSTTCLCADRVPHICVQTEYHMCADRVPHVVYRQSTTCLCADRVPHVCGGVQEEAWSDLDHEAGRALTRQGNLPLPQTQGHRRLEEGTMDATFSFVQPRSGLYLPN